MSTSTHDLRYLQTSDGTIGQFCLSRAYGLHEQQRFSPQYRITCRPSTLHRVICFQFIPINRKFDSSASLFVRFKLLRSYRVRSRPRFCLLQSTNRISSHNVSKASIYLRLLNIHQQGTSPNLETHFMGGRSKFYSVSIFNMEMTVSCSSALTRGWNNQAFESTPYG